MKFSALRMGFQNMQPICNRHCFLKISQVRSELYKQLASGHPCTVGHCKMVVGSAFLIEGFAGKFEAGKKRIGDTIW
jgi:hypothetical protein